MFTTLQFSALHRRLRRTFDLACGASCVMVLGSAAVDYTWFLMAAQGATAAAESAAWAATQKPYAADMGRLVAQSATAVASQQFPINTMRVSSGGGVLDGDRVTVDVTMAFQPVFGVVPTPGGFTARAERKIPGR